MDVNSILNGLMNASAWIEDVIINGLLGRGFALLSGQLAPFFIFFFSLFSALG